MLLALLQSITYCSGIFTNIYHLGISLRFHDLQKPTIAQESTPMVQIIEIIIDVIMLATFHFGWIGWVFTVAHLLLHIMITYLVRTPEGMEHVIVSTLNRLTKWDPVTEGGVAMDAGTQTFRDLAATYYMFNTYGFNNTVGLLTITAVISGLYLYKYR